MNEICDNVRETAENYLSSVDGFVGFSGFRQYFKNNVAQDWIHSIVEEAVDAQNRLDHIEGLGTDRFKGILKVQGHEREQRTGYYSHIYHFGSLSGVGGIAPHRHTDEAGERCQRVDHTRLVGVVVEIVLEEDGTEGIEGVLLEEREKVENFGSTEQCIVSVTTHWLNYGHDDDGKNTLVGLYLSPKIVHYPRKKCVPVSVDSNRSIQGLANLINLVALIDIL